MDIPESRPGEQASISSEEKFWAVISHLAVFAFGVGMFLPALGWADQRDRSNYASFQTLQALGYQSLGYTLWAIGWLLVMVVWAIVTAVSMRLGGGQIDSLSAIWAVVLLALCFVLLGLYLLFPLIGGIACARGRDFRYPILGNRLAKYIGYDASTPSASLISENEERFVASMGHFCIIFLLWGLFVPLGLWLMRQTRSSFLRFQCVQTTLYQALVTLISFGWIAAFMVSVFLAMSFAAGLKQATGLRLLLVAAFVLVGALLCIPLLQILGQWAGLRVLQGRNYHYPVLGRIVEHWLERRGPHAEKSNL